MIKIFIKKILALIVQNCKNFSIIQIKNSLFSKNIFNQRINFISFILQGTLFYSYMWLIKFNLFDLFQLIIFTLFSFALSIFISDKFKFSENKIIKFIQKFLFFNCILALIVLIGLILYFLVLDVSIFNIIFFDSEGEEDENNNKEKEESLKEKDVVRVTSNTEDKNNKKDYYTVQVSKKVFNNAVEKGPELIMEAVKIVALKIGVAAAAGMVAAEVFKQTSGMAVLPRIAVVVSTAVLLLLVSW